MMGIREMCVAVGNRVVPVGVNVTGSPYDAPYRNDLIPTARQRTEAALVSFTNHSQRSFHEEDCYCLPR